MMIDLLIYLIITIASIFIGLFLGKNFTRLKFEKKQATLEERNTILSDSFHEITEDLKKSQLEKEALIATKTRLGTELKNSELKLVENKKELDKIQEKFTKEFENLANKILDEKSSKFTEQNKLNITSILNPLKEKIEVFEKKVSESQKESIGMHSALKEQLNSLKNLNIQMSKEAINLTKALKGDSKTQGDWGETQLEILLEKANLAKDIHFTTQGGYRDEEGRLKKPDFIINLPDNRHLIVDSKVSLTNYEAYFNEEDEKQKGVYLKKHIESIRKHIKELSDKKYE
jgi:DNA recombination protein RmuC